MTKGKVSDERQRLDYLRLEALRVANTYGGNAPEKVVAMATAYYQFLIGK